MLCCEVRLEQYCTAPDIAVYLTSRLDQVLSPVIILLLFSLIGLAVKSIYSYDNELFLPAGMRDATARGAYTAFTEHKSSPFGASGFAPASGRLLFASEAPGAVGRQQALALCEKVLPTMQADYQPIQERFAAGGYNPLGPEGQWATGAFPLMEQRCSDNVTIQESSAALDAYAVQIANQGANPNPNATRAPTPVWAGLVVESVDAATAAWEYTIRVNASRVPSTRQLSVSLQVFPDTKWQEYFATGYIHLQGVAEQAMIDLSAANLGHEKAPQLHISPALI